MAASKKSKLLTNEPLAVVFFLYSDSGQLTPGRGIFFVAAGTADGRRPQALERLIRTA